MKKYVVGLTQEEFLACSLFSLWTRQNYSRDVASLPTRVGGVVTIRDGSPQVPV